MRSLLTRGRLFGLVLALLVTASCSNSPTGPSNTNNNNNNNTTNNNCGTTASGTFSGTVDGATYNATCIQATVANGVFGLVVTDGTTGLQFGWPSSGGNFSVNATGVLSGQAGVGTSLWIAGGNSGSGSVTATMTSTTAVGNLNMTLAAQPGTPASGNKTIVATFNIKF